MLPMQMGSLFPGAEPLVLEKLLTKGRNLSASLDWCNAPCHLPASQPNSQHFQAAPPIIDLSSCLLIECRHCSTLVTGPGLPLLPPCKAANLTGLRRNRNRNAAIRIVASSNAMPTVPEAHGLLNCRLWKCRTRMCAKGANHSVCSADFQELRVQLCACPFQTPPKVVQIEQNGRRSRHWLEERIQRRWQRHIPKSLKLS